MNKLLTERTSRENSRTFFVWFSKHPFMSWVLTHFTEDLHYWKMDHNAWSAELKYNGRALSFRLTAGDKRLFFIERAGFLQTKYLIKTEYSQVAGEVHLSKNKRSGVAMIENKRFNYSFSDRSLQLTGKDATVSLAIKPEDINDLSTGEVCALLFSTLKVTTKQGVAKAQLEMA